MLKSQEPKYRAVAPHYPENDGLQVQLTEGHLINRETGVPIPDDEPVIIFRARDKHAAAVIAFYLEKISEGPRSHIEAVHARLGHFLEFRAKHPDRMKEPD